MASPSLNHSRTPRIGLGGGDVNNQGVKTCLIILGVKPEAYRAAVY